MCDETPGTVWSQLSLSFVTPGFQELSQREHCVESAFPLREFLLLRSWEEKVEPGAPFCNQETV